jgi:PKD repeat protein
VISGWHIYLFFYNKPFFSEDCSSKTLSTIFIIKFSIFSILNFKDDYSMLKGLQVFLFVVSFFPVSAQFPLAKSWDHRSGGDKNDFISCVIQTRDGGFLLGGTSYSGISGDKSDSLWGGAGDMDYWIVKVNALGIKEWDKDFGGTENDYLKDIKQTTDGGFIVGGHSRSPVSGNKSQPVWGGTFSDYWILKLDSAGNIQWEKTYGGMSGDYLTSIIQTSDRGYLAGGYSVSDMGGDKSQNSWGDYDFWIIKLDSAGNKEWDKDFGGSGAEDMQVVRQLPDGNYIAGGSSISDISGDKSEPVWGPSGDTDYWIIKFDSTGNKIWDKDLGGTDTEFLYAMIVTRDSSLLVGGFSRSGIGGNKTQDTWGLTDYWIVKIDSTGNKIWDKDFGGSDLESEMNSLTEISEGGFLIVGTSFSPVSGNKTENNLGSVQTWIVKTDSAGGLEWEKTIFTTGHDQMSEGIQSADGCYLFALNTDGSIGGYISEPGRGMYDYWLVKFCDTTAAIAFVADDHEICPGTCVNFTNLTQNATSYSWNFFGANPDTSTATNPSGICYPSSGTYDVQLIAFNPAGSDTLLLTDYITVFPTPQSQAIIQNGDTLFANAGAVTYQWYLNDDSIAGATDFFYVATTNGDYNLVAVDSNGCESEAGLLNVMVGISMNAAANQFEIFPNPVKDFLILNWFNRNEAIDVNVYNTYGEKVLELKQADQPIDCRTIPPGIYSIEILDGDNIYRGKFLRQ